MGTSAEPNVDDILAQRAEERRQRRAEAQEEERRDAEQASAIAAFMARPIIVGGRTYKLLESATLTVERRWYIESEIEAGGFQKIFRDYAVTPEQDDDRADFIVMAYRTGHLFALVAGLLSEGGKTWTPALAAEQAAFFAAQTGGADAETLRTVVIIAAACFFVSAGRSKKISRNSLSVDGTDPISDKDLPGTESDDEES